MTLVIRTVAGLAIRFGVRTASRLVCPADWLARALANAMPTGPSFVADQQVDVGDLVAFADQGLADVHDDVGSHLSNLRGVIAFGSTVQAQVFRPSRSGCRVTNRIVSALTPALDLA